MANERKAGIDRESDVGADLQIGPTTLGMVRIFVAGGGVELPLDFEPDEALEIAEEIRLAAEKARAMAAKPSKPDHRPGGGAAKGSPRHDRAHGKAERGTRRGHTA